MTFKKDTSFQTPEVVCNLMAGMVPKNCKYLLEPTPGQGNLVKALEDKGLLVFKPKGDYWRMKHTVKYDCAVMNPPFTPVVEGWRYLQSVMDLTDNIICLLPWMIPINSGRRLKAIMDYGLVSITNLPRKTFPNSRVQCCILHMQRGYKGETIFKSF